MKAVAVEQALEFQQQGIAKDIGILAGGLLLLDPIPLAILNLPEVEHSAYPSTQTALALDKLTDGGWMLLRAGQVSKLTLTGLDGWTFDHADLNLQLRGPQIAIPPTPAPIIYNEIELGLGVGYQGTVRFEIPRFIHKIISVNRGVFSGLSYRADETYRDHFNDGGLSTSTTILTVNQKVAEISDWAVIVGPFTGSPQIIVDNQAMGLAISSAQDRLLHRAPQTLTAGQSAITPNLAEAFNQAGSDELTLNLMSQSDCVVYISGNLQRRRVVTGYTSSVPPSLTTSPWNTLSLIPNSVPSGGPQTTLITGKAKRTGPERLGLTTSNSASRLVLRAHPRLRIVQPFQPFVAKGQAPVTLNGLWLLLANAPETEGKLTVQIAPWDARRSVAGDPVARKTATLSPGLSNYETGPDGLLAAWIPFDEPWVIDPDQQPLLHAFTLSEVDAALPLVETAQNHAQLSPALYRDAGRTESLTQRRFGGVAKALMFDLGRDDPTATLGLGSAQVEIGPAFQDFAVALPHGTVLTTSDAAIEIEDLSATTTTAVQS